MTRQERREWKRHKRNRKLSYRTRRLTKHHLTNKVKGGSSNETNILILEENRHRAWHILFGNRDPFEAIELIERMTTAKRYQPERSIRP